MIIKDAIKKILFEHKASSKFLCKKGVIVGNGVFSLIQDRRLIFGGQ